MAGIKRERYSVLVRLDVVTDYDIVATGWEEALEKAKALALEDIVPGLSWIDGDGISLESISKAEG